MIHVDVSVYVQRLGVSCARITLPGLAPNLSGYRA